VGRRDDDTVRHGRIFRPAADGSRAPGSFERWPLPSPLGTVALAGWQSRRLVDRRRRGGAEPSTAIAD
jgi:hypothetical protein